MSLEGTWRTNGRRMQTNRKGGSEPPGSAGTAGTANELGNDSKAKASSTEEDMKLTGPVELDSPPQGKRAGAKANKSMDNTANSSLPKETARKSEAGGQLSQAIQFGREVFIEFKKISWPHGKEVVQATWSVLALVAIITLLVLAFDWLLATAFFGPLEHWARLHGGGVGLGR